MIRLSFAVHAVALVPLLLGAWPWALGAVAANHAILTLASLFPRSELLGPSLNRLPLGQAAGCVALTFDDGPDPEVTPAILDLLQAHGARATFFCIGRRAAAHPALMREIRARGHAIGNHTLRHPPWFALLGIAGQRAEWASAQAVLAETGPVSGWARAPLGLRSPLSDRVLHGLGLRHAAWTRRGFDTRCGDAATVLARISKDLGEGDIILLHDGNAARDAAGQPVSLAVLAALLPLLAARGLRSISLEASPASGPAIAAAGAGTPPEAGGA